MSEFEEQIKLRLTSNANDFDVIVLDMLKEIERLRAEAERWNRSNDIASQLFNQTRVDKERLNARVKELAQEIVVLRLYGNKDCIGMADDYLEELRTKSQEYTKHE